LLRVQLHARTREAYWLGVPEAGTYRKVLDTDAARFGGSGFNRQERVVTQLAPCQGIRVTSGSTCRRSARCFSSSQSEHA